MWVSLAVAFGTALLVTPLVRALARRRGLLDQPNERSSHRTLTPRGGGLAVVIGLAAALLARPGDWTATPPVVALLAGGAVVALIGLADDRFRLAPLPRLLGQLAVALALVRATGGLERLPLPPPADLPLGPFSGLTTVLWVLAVLNFMNFMDGIDGIAGLQTCITGAALALAGWDASASFVAAALVGGGLGFLAFNWSPASIFLGDVGSGFLGFVLASLPLLAPPRSRSAAVLLTATSLLLFLLDATTCLLRRMARGEKWYEAHRQHLYQRWVAAGASHARVSTWVGVGSAVLTVSALLAWRSGDRAWAWAALLLGVALCGLEWRVVVRAERRASGQLPEGARGGGGASAAGGV
jgi:Fuc2NAc and GlcNAc transferase